MVTIVTRVKRGNSNASMMQWEIACPVFQAVKFNLRVLISQPAAHCTLKAAEPQHVDIYARHLYTRRYTYLALCIHSGNT